jgi:hypothetical protein
MKSTKKPLPIEDAYVKLAFNEMELRRLYDGVNCEALLILVEQLQMLGVITAGDLSKRVRAKARRQSSFAKRELLAIAEQLDRIAVDPRIVPRVKRIKRRSNGD